MTEDQIALARRAVACKHWRWMPGMLTVDLERVVAVFDSGVLLLCDPMLDAGGDAAPRVFRDSSGGCIPDLTDPATLGCLLALVRAAWGDPELYCAAVEYGNEEPCSPWWYVWDTSHTMDASGGGARTEAEALVVSLDWSRFSTGASR